MKDINETPATESSPDKHFSGIKIFFIVLAVAVVTSMLTVWLSVLYFFPKQFKPVPSELSEKMKKITPMAASMMA